MGGSIQGRISPPKCQAHASLLTHAVKKSEKPKYLQLYSNIRTATLQISWSVPKSLVGEKSLNYFYLHNVVRKNYIWKGQALLGIVYFIRPESHSRIKLDFLRSDVGQHLGPTSFSA